MANPTSSGRMQFLVVDDFEPFRRFVCATLQARRDWQVIAEASGGLEAVHKAEELKPDLVLLDIGLPTLNGVQAAKRIATLVPDARILFISQHNDADAVTAALSDGAKGYIFKANANRELLTAAESVLQGCRLIGLGIIAQLAPKLAWQQR